MKKLMIGTVVVFMLTSSSTLLAQTMHCGNNLVRFGDYEHEVYNKCGAPSYQTASHWFYEHPGGAVKIVSFGAGIVQNIRMKRHYSR